MSHQALFRPAWTPLTIALMVIGFVVFWPLGLAMLAYILWGDRFEDMLADVRGNVRRAGAGTSGNHAFDDYRQRELARLEEERRRLDAEREEFSEFVRNLRRAKDQEEFDRFMTDRGTKASPAKADAGKSGPAAGEPGIAEA
ncbi:MAG: DUF2852 domain-containing protein [Hyphomicrobiales bacterium]